MNDKLKLEVRSSTGELITEHSFSAAVISEQTQESEGYKLAVLECHEVLDELGIPSAKGQECSDPKCKSDLGHRLRALRERGKANDAIIEQLKQVLSSNRGNGDYRLSEIAKLLDGGPSKH